MEKINKVVEVEVENNEQVEMNAELDIDIMDVAFTCFEAR